MNRYPLAAAFAALAFAAVDASAVTIRVTCEVGPARSKISVDGKRLPRGSYVTQALSGANLATAPAEPAVAGEVQTDYDSDPGNIGRGAVPIAPDFIVGATVTGKVLDMSGNTLISDTVSCRVRNR